VKSQFCVAGLFEITRLNQFARPFNKHFKKSTNNIPNEISTDIWQAFSSATF